MKGFTLIEIMVALMVFALMAALGYRGLDAVLSAHAHLGEDARKWRRLALAFASMEEAVGAATDAPVRGPDGEAAPAFVAVSSPRRDEEAVLAFTRTGFPGLEGSLADVQRTGYRLRAGRLEQLWWPVLDAGPRTEPQATALIDGVERLNLRYLAGDGAWHTGWPPPVPRAGLPRAMELTVEIAGMGTLTRLFVLP